MPSADSDIDIGVTGTAGYPLSYVLFGVPVSARKPMICMYP